jgi:hypothetical protein
MPLNLVVENPESLPPWHQRFLTGWAALVQVLRQPRMTAIATALGVTFT